MMNDSSTNWRWTSFAPLRLIDLAKFVKTTGIDRAVNSVVAYLEHKGVSFNSDKPKPSSSPLHRANAKRCGASKEASNFWLGS